MKDKKGWKVIKDINYKITKPTLLKVGRKIVKVIPKV